MKFLYKDLLRFIKENPSKELLSEKLFQLGHEHNVTGDIFNMELTPNRGDCLSLNGLARDLNSFFNYKKKLAIYDEKIEDLEIDFKNLSPEDCPKITFLEIEIDGEVSIYADYLESYFSILGNPKINFFTDVSNYLSYELGQPTHCYDASTIRGNLRFENTKCNTDFKTLLESEIKLTEKNCIFKSNDKIISLAGVMGGISTACSSTTKKALIECAFFNPEEIIGKSIKYNIVSDAAYKFERGVDISSQEKVLRRFIKIVKDHTFIKSLKFKSFSEHKIQKNKLAIDVNKINNILGTSISEIKFLNYLDKLGFSVEKEINIPHHRHDISSQNDLAEEIARVIGYDNISRQHFSIKNKPKKRDKTSQMIRQALIEKGFSEVINFPFSANENSQSIKVDNPLDSNRGFLRTDLRDSLLENLLYNERRQKESIKIFEISDIYSKNNQVNQEHKLGIIISGRRGNNYIDFTKKLDADYMRSTLSEIFNYKNPNIYEISRSQLRTKKKDKIFYLEVLIDEIIKDFSKEIELNELKKDFIKYKPVSEFPSSTRDFSFSIEDNENYTKVINHISDLKDINLKDSYIFDFYKNKNLGEVKVGLRLIFQSPKKTLSEDEIQNSIDNILSPIIDLEGVKIPGLN